MYHGLMHCSDWLPTLLSFAGVAEADKPPLMDGFDFSEVFRVVPFQTVAVSQQPELIANASHHGLFSHIYSDATPIHTPNKVSRILHDDTQEISVSPRNEILLEMYYNDDSIFGEELAALRVGDYKYIKGAGSTGGVFVALCILCHAFRHIPEMRDFKCNCFVKSFILHCTMNLLISV